MLKTFYHPLNITAAKNLFEFFPTTFVQFYSFWNFCSDSIFDVSGHIKVNRFFTQ